MKLYRFSPIKNEKELVKGVKYVAKENTKLCKKLTGKKLPISSITIFSHYRQEFQKLSAILHRLGSLYDENNGPRVTLHKPIKAAGHRITQLRIRKPDPYRMQVGCSDFDVNYEEFKTAFSKAKGLRIIRRQEYEMIEFFDPDFDVLAYVVNN